MLQLMADDLKQFLLTVPEIKSCRIIGSMSREKIDEYSDLDIEIDVSGIDNGRFLLKLPLLFAEKYNIIYYDYAPSMAPNKYIVSIAIDPKNPFRYVDIICTAQPHCTTIMREQLSALNNSYDHILKLFTANLKHYIRKKECHQDIERMYSRIYKEKINEDAQMLEAVFAWLRQNMEKKHKPYIDYLGEKMRLHCC